ncbi:hypothetical protein [Kitasatospora sp. NBC_01539]|uniref:hypothetical protein n=1 Tax=Kitasatospora sp. NBC_01539 TaxID=2903577 RepID=UPI0038601225
MTSSDLLFHVGFDGEPVADPYEIVDAGLEDPRHTTRVPALAELLADGSAAPEERYLACYALTSWGEAAGYRAVVEAARNPAAVAWYDTIIDRTYSVDGTFAQLAVAMEDGSDLAEEKGSGPDRALAVTALVGLADRVYFDGKLEYFLDAASVAANLEVIAATVRRGVRSLADGVPQRFDLSTQLVDLAAAAARTDAPLAIALATEVLAATPSHRALNHAVDLVYRTSGPERRGFAGYLAAVGDDAIRSRVTAALASS